MIILPRTTNDGKPRISYSQVTSFESVTAFNQLEKFKSISGVTGYALSYFMNYNFPPSPMDIYAPFGSDVEDAICSGDYSKFDTEETAILKQIKTIGTFQKEVVVDFGEFELTGYIDDCLPDLSYLRDYKTVSKKSAHDKYGNNNYYQLDVYALHKYMTEGRLPDKLEVCAIHRKGSHFKPPLKVEGFEYIDRPISEERLMMVKAKVDSTVREISDLYKAYLRVCGE